MPCTVGGVCLLAGMGGRPCLLRCGLRRGSVRRLRLLRRHLRHGLLRLQLALRHHLLLLRLLLVGTVHQRRQITRTNLNE